MLYLLLFLLIPLFAAYIFYVRIKTDHFFKLVLKGCLKIKQPLDFASYFSTHCLQNIVKSLIKNRKIKILFSLSLGRTSSAESFFKNKNNQICFIFLKSLKNYNDGISLLKSLPETSLSWELQIELAELYFLTEHYASAEKILQKMEENPDFIEIMKQYNGNTTILAALVNDPTLVDRIKKVAGSISINEMADVIKQCTDSSSTRVMLSALESHNPAEAIKITKQSKIFNLKDDTLTILSKTGVDNSRKKDELENLYQSGGKQREIIG